MRRLRSRNPQKEIINTISYFAFFSYTPDFEQIFTFFPRKITRNSLKILLEGMVKSEKLVKVEIKTQQDPLPRQNKLKLKDTKRSILTLYTLPQYSIYIKNRALRGEITILKLQRVKNYFRVLSRIPCILYTGISGSAAMGNCRKTDDVDLCIVTASDLLFTGRFLAILLAILFRVRNLREGVCLNLFFDERDLAFPDKKKTPYVAHEVLQMRTVFDKQSIHTRFLRENIWLTDYFPNAELRGQGVRKPKPNLAVLLLQPVEFLLRSLQLAVIKKNKTGHYLSPTQLWLFRQDFGKRLKHLRQS